MDCHPCGELFILGWCAGLKRWGGLCPRSQGPLSPTEGVDIGQGKLFPRPLEEA